MEDVLDPKRTAFIVADMQRDIVSAFAFDQGVVARMAKAIAGARQRGLAILYVVVHRRADGRDAVPAVTDAARQAAQGGQTRALPRDFLCEGAPGTEIVDELTPQPGDYTVVKRRVSAFHGTSLELFLRSAKIDTILIGGVATNMVVEGTCREARDRDFNCVVLSDCCSGPSREIHEWTLANSFSWMARVRTADQTMAMLDQFSRKGEG